MGVAKGTIQGAVAAGVALVALSTAIPSPSLSPKRPSWGPEASVQDPSPGGDQADDQIDAMIARLGDPGEPAAVLNDGFNLFIERMDAYDGRGSVRLARALFERSPAVWSAFVLEGALRRSAPADPRAEVSIAAYEEAETALEDLVASPRTSGPDRVALIQRRAILAAGFDRPRAERQALGAALASGGVDGAQILGLAALTTNERETAAALFASLLDRSSPEPADQPPDVDPAPAEARERPPWALRGHSLAVLEQLISRH